MRLRIIALDLDGTIVNSAGITTEYTKRILKEAYEKGFLIVPVTGRSISHIPDWIRKAEYIDYVITANGARTIDMRTGNSTLCDMMTREQMLRVLSLGKLMGEELFVSWNLHVDSKVYREDNFGDPRPMNPKIILPMGMHEYVEKYGENCEIEKMDAYFRDSGQKNRVFEAVKGWDDMYISSANSNNVEFNNSTANKGEALKRLAALLGAELEASMAFGDGLNDLLMLKAVGISVAMSNAVPELKHEAKYIAKSCEEDGAALFIKNKLNKETER